MEQCSSMYDFESIHICWMLHSQDKTVFGLWDTPYRECFVKWPLISWGGGESLGESLARVTLENFHSALWVGCIWYLACQVETKHYSAAYFMQSRVQYTIYVWTFVKDGDKSDHDAS